MGALERCGAGGRAGAVLLNKHDKSSSGSCIPDFCLSSAINNFIAWAGQISVPCFACLQSNRAADNDLCAQLQGVPSTQLPLPLPGMRVPGVKQLLEKCSINQGILGRLGLKGP